MAENILWTANLDFLESLPKEWALSLLEKALALNPNLAMAHYLKAEILHTRFEKLIRAERIYHLRRAIELVLPEEEHNWAQRELNELVEISRSSTEPSRNAQDGGIGVSKLATIEQIKQAARDGGVERFEAPARGITAATIYP